MTRYKLLSVLRFYNKFIPIKRNGLVFFVAVYLLSQFIRYEFYGEESQFIPFLNVFVWLIGVFGAAIVGLGLLYTLFCWLFFAIKSDQVIIDLTIGLEDGQKGEAGEVPVSLTLSKAIMPMIGYLKTWMVFEEGDVVGPIVINKFSGGWKDLMSKEGQANLNMTRRAQYKVSGFVFSFEDYLQFFRFSWLRKTKKIFYLHSQKRDVSNTDFPPSKAREELEKVQTSKRVEGDFLNYKDFESGDDVRRIVWKIFAKSKDLVVRVPEVINPYASHLHFFASFQNTLLPKDSGFALGMLDYYKDIIYNTCVQIEKYGRKVEFSMDQEVGDSLIVDKKDLLGYFLSCAKWREGDLNEHFPTITSSSVICVSSMIPSDQLETLARNRPVTLLVVQVSKYLDEKNLFNWTNMVLQNDEESEVGKLKWLLSSQRSKLKRNEERISQLVESTDFQGQLI